MTYYQPTQLHPGIYSLYEPSEVFCYLLVGEKEAILYDTTFGFGDLRAAVREITDLPLTVILSHGHYDHANGAHQFDGAYIHPADEVLCLKHASRTGRRRNALEPFAELIPATLNQDAYIHAGAGTLKPIEAGKIFHLGGMTVEVIALEGHTAGSIGLLIHEQRVLLASDALGPHIWLFLNESLPIPNYVKMLQRIQSLPFNTFYIGHSNQPRPKSDIAHYEKVAKNAHPAAATPYPKLPELGGLLYNEVIDGETVGIIFKSVG